MIEHFYVCDNCKNRINDAFQVYKFLLVKTTLTEEVCDDNAFDLCPKCANEVIFGLKNKKPTEKSNQK